MRAVCITKTFGLGVGAPCALHRGHFVTDSVVAVQFPAAQCQYSVVYHSTDLTGNEKQCQMCVCLLRGHAFSCTHRTCLPVYVCYNSVHLKGNASKKLGQLWSQVYTGGTA